MKQRNFIDLNIEMTKRLFKASPKFFCINLINTLFNTFVFIFQTLFYKYIIDAIIYFETSPKDILWKLLCYYMVTVISYISNYWVKDRFNVIEKVKISLYYKKWICNESAQKSVSLYGSSEYKDKLYNAVYGDGDYLFSFSERLFGLIDGIIVLLFFIKLFFGLHPILVIIAILMAVKNLKVSSKKKKIQYQLYKNNLCFDRYNTYIRNMFFQKQYAEEIRLFSIGKLFIGKFQKNKISQWNENKQFFCKDTKLNIVSEVLDLLLNVANIFVLVWSLINSMITVGGFSMVLANFRTVVNNLQGILNFLVNIYDDGNYINDILSVIETEKHTFPEVQLDKEKACVKFKDVNFAYKEDQIVLKDINIDLPLDKKMAIVGENGSGKSTFVKLLMGLYEPTEGKIEYFFPQENIKNTMDLFSIMLQDYRIFPLSIAENIVLTDEINKEQQMKLEEALSFSELKEKVENLPKGIDTIITGEFAEDGIGLSGGELQKLALSRAYFSKKPILILDEPSSNLDPVAENHLIKKLNELSDKKAVILIAHNIFYTQNVDLVLFFEQGKIVEFGSPSELIEKRGYYYRMLMEQKRLVCERTETNVQC